MPSDENRTELDWAINSSDGAAQFFVRVVSWSFILKFASLGLGFLTSVVLARLLGAEGFGDFSFPMAIVELLLVPTTLGFPSLVVRELARYQVQSKWALLLVHCIV